MKKRHICLDCIEHAMGKPAYDLPIAVFNQIKIEMAFVGDVCPECGSMNLKQVLGVETSYVKGYGYADKNGIKRDMDIHTITSGRDPYKEHRKMGESRELVVKLQKDREHHVNSKTIKMG